MSDSSSDSQIPRRTFARRMAGAGVLATLTGCGGSMVDVEGGGPATDASPTEYIDFHTHLGQKWGNRPALSADELLDWMDANNVLQAVVHPLESPEAYDYPISTNYVLEQTKPHRGRLVPAAVIDPRVRSLIQAEENGVRDLLKRYRDAGARVFGEHKPGVAIDDPRSLELYDACGAVGLPVMFHMDSIRCTDSVGLPGLERALDQVPGCTFVGHAQAFWASISGDATEDQFQGYPSGEVTSRGALDRLMSDYDNLYGDLGAGSGANAIARDKEFGRDFIIRHADRLVWSTDYLAPGQDPEQLDLYPSLDLPEDVRRKVYRENSRDLLSMEEDGG